MKYVISNIMRRAGISQERLKQERMILTHVAQPLFWEYWSFVLNNPITKWETPSGILYAENDDMMPEDRQKFCATIWLHIKRYEKRRTLVSYAAAARLFAQLDQICG